MQSELLDLMENIKRKNATSLDKIKLVEEIVNINFPQDYIDWMLLSNGGSGFVSPNSYILLWSIEQVVSFNQSYRQGEHIPSLVLFGSDGGEERYAFDIRSASLSVVRVRLEEVNVKNIITLGRDFIDFLRNLKKM